MQEESVNLSAQKPHRYDVLTDPWDEDAFINTFNVDYIACDEPSRTMLPRIHASSGGLRDHLALCLQIARIVINMLGEMEWNALPWITRYEIGISKVSYYRSLQILNCWINFTFDGLEMEASKICGIEYQSMQEPSSVIAFLGSRNGWEEWRDGNGRPWRYRSFATHGNNLLDILLPRFNQAKFEVDALSRFRPDFFEPNGHAKIDAQVLAAGSDVLDTLIVGLDIAESAAKLIPVAGDFVEGACGMLRKILLAAKRAVSLKESCSRTATEITQMTLEVVKGLVASGEDQKAGIPLFNLYSALQHAEQVILQISSIKRHKVFLNISKYEAKLQEVRERVDSAYRVFNIQSHVGITSLVRELGYQMSELEAQQDKIIRETRAIRVGQARIEDRTQDIHRILIQFASPPRPDLTRISVVSDTIVPVA